MGEIVRLFPNPPHRVLTDRQKFSRAVREQKPREEWERELDAMIGSPDDDFTPGNAA